MKPVQPVDGTETNNKNTAKVIQIDLQIKKKISRYENDLYKAILASVEHLK